MPNVTRNLSNEQRARLEQIANDEFAIKRNEVARAKMDEFNKWKDAEIKKMENSSLAKEYVKLRKQLDTTIDKICAKGFSVDMVNGKAHCAIRESGGYSGVQSRKINKHPKYDQMYKKAAVDNDAFTRAKNEVLSVIWSMEQPFSTCVKLIRDKVKSIR